MIDFFSIQLKKNIQKPLYLQLGENLSLLAKNGTFKPNTKLPPIRKMAKMLNLNTVTVVNAYKYLENQNIVYTKKGSGTYINTIYNTIVKEERFDLDKTINFANTSISADLFPYNSFKKIFGELLDRDRGYAFSAPEFFGNESLRESLTEILKKEHIITTKDNVQIIPTVAEGVGIISKLFLRVGDVAFIEKPSNLSVLNQFLTRGIKIIEIPLRKNGIDIDMLKQMIKTYRPKIICVSSYFQIPTGITYSIEIKMNLLDLAHKNNIIILEEDSLGYLNYTNETTYTLKSLDNYNVVIYLKCFSKYVLPEMNIGLIVYNDRLIKTPPDITFNYPEGFIQKGLDIFIRNNEFSQHLARIKNYYFEKYKTAISYFSKYLSEYYLLREPCGGLNLWLKLLNEDMSLETICGNLLKSGVIVQPSALFYINKENDLHIRISFSNVSDTELEKGMLEISQCMKRLN